MAKTQSKTEKYQASLWQPRPPVVTILGHIDHGKTSLLDFIRQASVAAKEAGGITQHIGAYQVKLKIDNQEKLITFIDTPGHKAFSQMRSRGAKVADIALLVISIKDGIMPQTKESVAYIKKAKIPMVVAINKIDLLRAKSERQVVIKKIEKQLANLDVALEKQGGEVIVLPISAKTGENVKELLEMIVLLAEVQELRVKKDSALKGVIIDSLIDQKKGVLATVLVREGNLKVKEEIEVEGIKGKVRALFDEYGKRVRSADPSKPVQVLGFKKAPPIGGIVSGKGQKPVSFPSRPSSSLAKEPDKQLLSPEDSEGKLRVILKTDTLGTKEAVLVALEERVEIVASSIGDINQSDIFLAKTSKAPILGFGVNLSSAMKKLAEEEKVKVKTYQVIYQLLEEVEEIIRFIKEGKKEKILGQAKIIAQFEVKDKKIAGAKVIEGRLARGDKVKVLRGEEEIGQARISSLRHQKEDIKKAEMETECGLSFSKELDFEVGDVVKSIG